MIFYKKQWIFLKKKIFKTIFQKINELTSMKCFQMGLCDT